MSKRLSRAELKFRKDVKQEIDYNSKPDKPQIWWGGRPNPIFIPKRGKKK